MHVISVKKRILPGLVLLALLAGCTPHGAKRPETCLPAAAKTFPCQPCRCTMRGA